MRTRRARTARPWPSILLLVAIAVVAPAFVGPLREHAAVFWLTGFVLAVAALVQALGGPGLPGPGTRAMHARSPRGR